MQSYIGDRNEVIYGVDGTILPDGTKVIAAARSSTKNGTGVVVYKSTDGFNWETNFLFTNVLPAGVVIDPRDGRIFTMRAGTNGTSFVIYVSTDFGATWTESTIVHGITSTYTTFNVLVWDRTNNRILITNKTTASATTAFNVILQSTDFGSTWTTAFSKSDSLAVTCNLFQTDGGPYGVMGRYTNSNGTNPAVLYTTSASPTINSVVNPEGVVFMMQSTSTGRLTYNPISNNYLQYNCAGPQLPYYIQTDPATFGTVTSAPSPLNSGETTSAVAYSSSALGFVGSTKGSATGIAAQTVQRIIRSKYGGSGNTAWKFDPTPEFNTSNLEITFMLDDPATKMLYTYTSGSIYEGNGMGYISTIADLPTPSQTPTPSVSSAATLDNDVVIGGNFTSVNGDSTYNRYALLANNGVDVKSGLVDMLPTGAIVTCTLLVPNSNDVLLFGSLTSYAGVAVNRVARIDRSGTINTEFNFSVSASNGVIQMAVLGPDDNVYFATNNGRIVKMDLLGTVDTTWGTSIPASGSMAIHYDKISNKFFVASPTRIYRVNLDGTIDNTFTTPVINGAVYAMVVQPNGKLIVTGAFTTMSSGFDNFTRPYIGCVNTNGSVDPSWYFAFTGSPSLTTGGKQLAVDDYGVYISTSTGNVESSGRNFMVRVKFDGRLDQSFAPVFNAAVYSIDITEDKRILLSGTFTTVNGTARPYSARLFADGTLDTTFTPTTLPNSGIRTISDYDKPVLTLTPTPTPSVTPTPSQVPQVMYNVAVAGNNMVINGLSTAIGSGILTNAGNAFVSDPANVITGGAVYSIQEAIDGSGDLFFFGNPNLVQGSSTAASIVRVTKTGEIVPTFVGGTNLLIGSILQVGSDIYFTNSAQRIHKMNAITGEVTLNWSTGNSTSAYSKLAFDSVNQQIYVYIASNISKWNLDGTRDDTWTTPSIGTGSNIVFSIKVQPTDGKVVVVHGYNNNSGYRISRFNTDSTLDTTFGSNGVVALNGSPALTYCNDIMTVTKDGIYIAGSFSTVGGVTVPNFTRLRLSDGVVDPTFTPIITVQANSVYSVTVGQDQRPIIAGTFTQINGVARGGVARLKFDGSLDTTFTGPTKTSGTTYTALALTV